MKAMLRVLTLAAAAALALPAAASLAPGDTLPATPARWWAPFNDSVLDSLALRAAGNPTAQLALVRSYVELRTAQARLALAERLQEAAQQQHALLQQADPPKTEDADERSRWLAALAARVEHWRGVQQVLAGERDRVEVTLAALSRSEVPALRVQAAAAAGVLPQVGLEVPFRLPTAAGDAGNRLQALQAAAARVQQAQQLVEASDLELRSHQLRQQAGVETPLEVIESYQRLLGDADRLAASSGALAVAWAQLLQGAAPDLVTALAGRVRGTDPAPRAR